MDAQETPAQDEEARRARRFALLAAGIAVLAWAPGIPGGFISDDEATLVLNAHIRDFSWPGLWFLLSDRGALSSISDYPGWRPLRLAINMVEYRVYGLEAFWYRLVNVLCHGAATGLAVLLARRFGLGAGAALVAGLFFGLHPAQAESVLWIKEREGVLSAAFLFGALLLADRRGAAAFAGCMACVALALLAKETGVLFAPLLAVLAGADWLAGRRDRARLARMAAAGAGGLALSVLYLWARARIMGSMAQQDGPMGGTWGATLWTMSEAFWRYAAWVVAPGRFYFSFDFLDTDGPTAWMAAGGVALLVVLPAAALVLARRAPVAAAGIAVYLLALGPASNLVPMIQWMAVRFLYLPLFGAGLCAGALFEWARAKGGTGLRAAPLWAGVALAALSMMSVAQSFAWRSNATLAMYQWQAGNRSLEARWLYAMALNSRGRHQEAAELMRGFPFDEMPLRKPGAFIAAARAEAGLGEFEAAYAVLAEGLARMPGSLLLLDAAVIPAMETGRMAEAEEILRRLAEEPAFARRSWARLGVLLLMEGRLDEARAAQARAEALAGSSNRAEEAP